MPGVRTFEYAVSVHAGDWKAARILTRAAEGYAPVRAAMTGRGQGELPREASLFALDDANVHVTCVKCAEDGNGLVIRLFNPLDEAQAPTLTFGRAVEKAELCRLDESPTDEGGIETLAVSGATLTLRVPAKKIRTVRVTLRG